MEIAYVSGGLSIVGVIVGIILTTYLESKRNKPIFKIDSMDIAATYYSQDNTTGEVSVSNKNIHNAIYLKIRWDFDIYNIGNLSTGINKVILLVNTDKSETISSREFLIRGKESSRHSFTLLPGYIENISKEFTIYPNDSQYLFTYEGLDNAELIIYVSDIYRNKFQETKGIKNHLLDERFLDKKYYHFGE
ncbi:hypothetical protein Q9251_02880 [Alkalihalobacillus macyae]|uniref:hypothetical protein n=1 Tax=Guptibacillus hwajinpoensis TaxID=208199 RepID=UPI00273C1BDD|nr:hypothetical protein [Alkalihalobacillus macyae]MDP4549819.1 hypothetical protein [Alkalihalobacillus macyae]